MIRSILGVALLCCCSLFANAQSNTLTINNTTPCTIYITVYGTTNGNGCATDYKTPVYAITPGSTFYSDPTAVPSGIHGSGTLGATDKFTMVRVYSSDTHGSCTVSNAAMSDCATGSSSSVTSFTFDDTFCTTCATADLDYVVIGNDAILTIQ